MEDTKTITLRKPVKLGDLEYTKVELREPFADELAKASKAGNNIEVAIALISVVGAIPKAAVGRFCQRDLQECSNFLDSFQLPIVSETSSPS